jgi:hypothetical protein
MRCFPCGHFFGGFARASFNKAARRQQFFPGGFLSCELGALLFQRPDTV